VIRNNLRRWTDSGNARDSLVELFGGCRFALLGEASHGTHARRQDCPAHWHHPPLLFRAHSRRAGWLETGGPVSGLLSDIRFESGSKDLLPGDDLFVLYTDSVVEAHNYDGMEFSRDRLLAVVASHSEVSAEDLTRTIYSSVVDFSGKDRLEDDLTVVVLKAVSNTSD
jgi:Stage II sporulation protein E (SpoIIE)